MDPFVDSYPASVSRVRPSTYDLVLLGVTRLSRKQPSSQWCPLPLGIEHLIFVFLAENSLETERDRAQLLHGLCLRRWRWDGMGGDGWEHPHAAAWV